jgi:hypothetical protein
MVSVKNIEEEEEITIVVGLASLLRGSCKAIDE